MLICKNSLIYYSRITKSASVIQSSALAVLAVRQQNIYCSPDPSMSHSERESD